MMLNMGIFIIGSLLFLLVKAHQQLTTAFGTCESPPLTNNECGFYTDCLETHYPCGDDGYALGYGFKYCQRFSEYEGCDDQYWKDWVNGTLSCLQQSLVPVVETNPDLLTCDGIKSTAFDSHPKCYTGDGTESPSAPSICFLPVRDQACVLKIIDKRDLIHPEDIKQELTTAAICVKQLTYRGLCHRGPAGDHDTENCRYWRDILKGKSATVVS